MNTRQLCAVAAAAAVAFGLLGASPAYADPSPDEVRADIDELSKKLDKAVDDYNGAKNDLEDIEDRIEEIEKELPDLEEDVANARVIVSDIAASSYVSGHQVSSVETLLAGSPESALQRMTVLGAITSSQGSDIEAFSDSATDLEDEQATLKDLKSEQKDIVDDLKKKKKDLEGEMSELEDLLAQVDPTSSGIDGAPPPAGDFAAAVQYAYDQVGDPYAWGASGPDSFDCSGLTMMAWSELGVGLSHQASAQWNETARVGRGDLVPGDLVFYNDLAHVAIFAGDGQIVHAPTSGQSVSVADMDEMPIVGYGRPYM
ncbi:MAG: NlpC/P60 family protein [Stackebrandtia sp.]